MTAFEKEVLDRLARIEENQKRDYRLLNGNGHPGLIDKCDDLDRRIVTLEAERTAEAKSHHKFLAFIGWLATTAIALYAAIFRN